MRIKEIELGIIKCTFIKDNIEHEVYFKHIIFPYNGESNLQTKNWIIYGNNVLLNKEIFNIILKSDKNDFNFFNDKEYNKTIPFGVVLTITSKCNIFCYYCFNDIDYDLKTRNKRKDKQLDYWKKTIDKLYNSGTRVIILTGGEPMVAPFFWDLLEYISNRNIFIHLNTNGTLLTDYNLEKLNNNFSVNIMVSMHEFNDKDYYEINKKGLTMTFGINKIPSKFKTMFSDKVKQLRKINNLENISLEFLTILVRKNILNLEKIYSFTKKSGIDLDSWQFFRLYSTKNNKGATTAMMNLAVNKMYLLNKKYGFNNKIVDPVPFCVTKNTDRARDVIDGVLSDTHDVKTIITTDGYIQLMSAYDNNFWHIDRNTFTEVFEDNFTKKMLNNGFLPKECNNCKHKTECKGGSRMDANIFKGDYSKFDPIGNLDNIK